MAVLYVVEQGATLRKTGERLLVTKDGVTLASVPTIKVQQVVIFGNVQLTTQVIVHLLLSSVDVVFLATSGRYYGRLLSSESTYGDLRQRQMRFVDDPVRALPVAQQFVRAKLLNQQRVLVKWSDLQPDRSLASIIRDLGELAERVPRTQQINSLMGVEGKGSALYFSGFRSLLTQDLGFSVRNRRPPRDPINAMLSFGYTLLVYSIQSVVQTIGLDPYLGFLHAPAYSRPSLVLDLMEEFRPSVIDELILTQVNGRRLSAADFVTDTDDPDRPVLLTDDGRRRFLAAYEAILSPRPPVSGEAATGFRRLFEVNARQIARLASGQQSEYRPWLAS